MPLIMLLADAINDAIVLVLSAIFPTEIGNARKIPPRLVS
jgi:hypothetical protein